MNRLSPSAASECSLSVVLVVVTYGARWALLERALYAAFDEGVASAIVVDNASSDNIPERVGDKFGDKVEVVSLKTNTGSAHGFRTGIEVAIQRGAQLIWLMDDDNLAQPGSLVALLSQYKNLASHAPTDRFALLSFRPEHQPDVAAGVPLKRCYPRPGSFFGFHVADIPYKVWRRTSWGRPKVLKQLPDLIAVPHAPYSGFLFHRNLIDRIGLPDATFVLYADDTEFTNRLTSTGGVIHLVTSSRVRDMEFSWNSKTEYGNSFGTWLRGGSDFRAFYSARNQACYEQRNNQRPIAYAVNRGFYMMLMWLQALRWNRRERLRLVRGAIRDGQAGRLGMSAKFPLV